MECNELQERLSAFIDEACDEGERIAIEAHLSECAECRAERESLMTLDAALRKAFLPEQRQADRVAESVLRDVVAGEGTSPAASARWQRRFHWVVPYLPAAAAGFLLATGLFQPWRHEDPRVNPRVPVQLQVDDDTEAFVMPVAHLVHATGPVSFRTPTDDAWVSVGREAIPTFTCPSESAVRTEPGSLCELETTSGSRIRLNESSEITLRSEEELVLVNGQIWCRTTEKDVLRVVAQEAPQADSLWTLRCPGSASCLTSSSPEGPLQVVTAAGKVDLIVNGTAQEIPSGRCCTLNQSEVTVRESEDDLLQAERWMQPLLTMGGHRNAELIARVDALLAGIGRAKVSSLYEQDLRNLGEYGALPLLRYVQSPKSRQEPPRRIVAMRIIADTAPIWMVPDLIALLEDDTPEVRSDAAAALTRLTGQTQGLTPSDWQSDRAQWSQAVANWKQWWQQHQFSCSPQPPGV